MQPENDTTRPPSTRLYEHILRRHERGGLLAGPDVGLRWRYRVLRFVDSYLPVIPSRNWVFQQAQGYWIRVNWRLFERTGDPRHEAAARRCAERVLALQNPDGSWSYPLPERKHLKATVEGCFGAMGLLETWRRTGDPRLLDGASAWCRYMVETIGFQTWQGTLAVNYFDKPRGNIPNNSVDALWVLEELRYSMSDDRYARERNGMIDFLSLCQLPTGELPYNVESPFEPRREHYLCFQYNAFQFVKLARCFELTGDARYGRLLAPLAGFLAGGVGPDGFCKADCAKDTPHVPYWTAILAEALHTATRLGFGDHREAVSRLLATILPMQRADGGFDFSHRDSGGLVDRGSYPRNQAMILESLMEVLDEQPKKSATGSRAG